MSYEFLITGADTVANFDIMLITEYADSAQLACSEERFQKIIKEIRRDGPKLLKKPKEQLGPGRWEAIFFYLCREQIIEKILTKQAHEKIPVIYNLNLLGYFMLQNSSL